MNLEKLSVPIAIVIAGALIAGALYFSNIKASKQVSVTTGTVGENAAENMKPITAVDHILGNPDAELIIVEYSDTECPYCKQFHSTLRRVMSEYGKDGKVAWVYRHFPISSLHSKAPKEAEALECANELGGPTKFWEYTNLLYDTTNSNDSLNPAELPNMAKKVGLDVALFNSCLESGKYAELVQANYDDAIKTGARGTPNSILLSKDGTKTVLQGSQSYESFKIVLDALLK